MYLKLWRIVSLKVRARMNVAAMSLLINLHTGTFNVAVCIRQTLWEFLGEVFKHFEFQLNQLLSEGIPFPFRPRYSIKKRSTVLKWGGSRVDPNWARERCILKASTPSSCVKIIWAECAAAKSSTNLWDLISKFQCWHIQIVYFFKANSMQMKQKCIENR